MGNRTSSDSSLLAGGRKGKIRSWNFGDRDGEDMPGNKSVSVGHSVTSIHKLQNGEIVAGFGDGVLRTFAQTKKRGWIMKKKLIGGHSKGYVHGLDFSKSNSLLLSTSGSFVKLWKQSTQDLGGCFSYLTSFRDHSKEQTYCVKFLSQKSSLIASSDRKGKVVFHDISKCVMTSSHSVHSSGIFSMDYGEGKSVLFSCSEDKKVKLFDVKQGKVIHCIEDQHQKKLKSILYLPQTQEFLVGEGIFSISSKHWIYCYDCRMLNGKPRKKWIAHENAIFRLIDMKDEGFVSSCSCDSSVKIWNCRNDFRQCGEMVHPKEQFYSLCYVLNEFHPIDKIVRDEENRKEKMEEEQEQEFEDEEDDDDDSEDDNDEMLEEEEGQLVEEKEEEPKLERIDHIEKKGEHVTHDEIVAELKRKLHEKDYELHRISRKNEELKDLLKMNVKQLGKREEFERVERWKIERHVNRKNRIKKYLSKQIQEEFELLNLSKFYRKKEYLDFHQTIHDKDFFDAGRLREFEEFDRICLKKPKIREKNHYYEFRILMVDHQNDEKLKIFKKSMLEKHQDNIRMLQYRLSKEIEGDSSERQRTLSRLKDEILQLMKNVSDFYGGCPGDSRKCRKEVVQKLSQRNDGILYLGEIENGVCRHRSIMFKLVCDMLGIQCRILRGLFEGFTSCSVHSRLLHAWNLVHIGDEYYTVDLMNCLELIESGFSQFSEKMGFDGKWTIFGARKMKEENVVKRITENFLECERKEEYLKVIGSGMLGTVYEINLDDKKLSFALKVVDPVGLGDLCCEKQVKREVAFLQFMKHENIVKCLGSFSFFPTKKRKRKKRRNVYVIILEKLDGNGHDLILDLKECGEPHTQLRETLIFLLEVAKGLKYLHQLNIIHLDLKLTNVLINFEEEKKEIESVKIIDFGGSKVKYFGFVSRCSTISESFAAPEVIAKKKFDERADIFSFGKIMEQFEKEGFFQIYSQMSKLKNKCLSQRKEDRPSMDEIMFVVRKHLLYLNENSKKGVCF